MRGRWLSVVIGTIALMATGLSFAPIQASASVPTEIRASGVIVVVPREAPAPGRGGTAAKGGAEVKLASDDGPIVELTGTDPATYRTGARFTGTLTVPRSIVSAVEANLAASGRGDAGSLPKAVLAAASKQGTALAVASSQIKVVRPTDGGPRHTISVMTLGYSGDAPASSDADIRTSVAAASSFWETESADQISSVRLAGPILHRTVRRGSFDICDADQAWAYAAGRMGFNKPSSYWFGGYGHHLLVLLPYSRCSGSWWGLGTLGASLHQGGLMAMVLEPEPPIAHNSVLFHEMGHNFSLDHSAQRTCASRAIDAPLDASGEVTRPCVDREYDDYYDVMGGSFTLWLNGVDVLNNIHHPAALNVTHRSQINALPRGLRKMTINGGTTQTVTIRPSDSTGIRGLRITDPRTKEKLFVEYRYPTGADKLSLYARYYRWDSDGWVAPGVRIMRQTGNGYGLSVALSRHRSGSVKQVMWWPAGTTATTHTGNIKVKVVSTNSRSATVRVTLSR